MRSSKPLAVAAAWRSGDPAVSQGYGKACKFAHGLEELKILPSNKRRGLLMSRKKVEVYGNRSFRDDISPKTGWLSFASQLWF